MLYVTSNNGVKIAVYDLNPCGCKTVLLIHGWPLSYKMYEYQESLLVNRNYRVVSIDLRGFGNSDVPFSGYCYNQMAEDIYHVVCALNLKNFSLVGFSMGGAIVLRYMRLYAGYEVKQLLLLAAAAPSWTKRPGFPYGVTKESVDELIHMAMTDRAKLAENFSHSMLFASKHSEPIMNWFEDISLSASGIGTIQTACSLREEDGREDLKYVHVPTAVFQGDKDLVVPSNLTCYQANHIRGARFYHFENSGHGIIYDELDRFNRCFIEFLDSCC